MGEFGRESNVLEALRRSGVGDDEREKRKGGIIRVSGTWKFFSYP